MVWISKERGVLFVVPPSGLYRRDDRCQSRVEDQAVRVILPPTDLALLAAVARRAGYEAAIADYPAQGGGWADLDADLRRARPGVVFFNVTTATLDADLRVARMARAAAGDALVIGRGDCLERLGEEVMGRCGELDMALHGEAEENFEAILNGAAPETLEGLVVRDGSSGEAIRRAGSPVVSDLDNLPFPARDLLNNGLYVSPETGRAITVIRAARGCFAHCIFCPAGARRLRTRSPEGIVGELRECVERFGIRDFLFDGDTFTARREWLLDLCGRIEEAGLAIRWGCNSRVDTMDDARAEALARAGCVLVAFGVESGDQEMLDRMRKGTRVEQAVAAVAACKRAGLGTHAFYIVGLPWETAASLDKTYRLMQRLDTDLFDINIATPLPGTEFDAIARRDGLLSAPGGGQAGSYAHASVRTHALSAEDLTRWRRRTLLRLYARPGYVLRILRQAARRGHLRHYVRAAFGRLRTLAWG